MCGIAALVVDKPRPLAQLLESMTAAVRHRGPDGEGVVLLGDSGPPRGGDDPVRIGLGHRRLAIVDLTPAGDQPMATADGQIWITYNGEVYNHVELRSELERAGDRFASRSDTEVILHAYRRWGTRCLDRFNGMFAFVIVDRERGRLFAARDRFGVKPLYRWQSPDGVVAFASEIKQLTGLPGWRAVADGQRAHDFLAWGVTDHSAHTLFAGVSQLRGGEYIDCAIEDVARAEPVSWYRPPAGPMFDGELDAAAARLGELLNDSVRLRLRADVSVGSCLSGGLDSSSIVCLVHGLLDGEHPPHRTFSARSDVPRFDESAYADEVVNVTGADGRFTLPAPGGLFDALPELTWHQDEPFGSTSIYAQWLVFGLAAATGTKVVLDGQGADEILSGYHGSFAIRYAGLARAGRWRELWAETAAAGALGVQTLAAAVGQTAAQLVPERARRPLRALRGKDGAGLDRWIDAGALAAAPDRPAPLAGWRGLRDAARAQLLHTSLPMLLHWEDRSSMAHSVESRLPFLDYRVVELALGMPDALKLSRGVTKRVLREAMRGILPERVRTRRDKLGFATAEEQWLRERAPAQFRRALARAIEQSRGALRPEARDLCEQTIAGRRPFSFQIWRMISFGAWMDRFGVALG